jgi:hypothetical protein
LEVGLGVGVGCTFDWWVHRRLVISAVFKVVAKDGLFFFERYGFIFKLTFFSE